MSELSAVELTLVRELLAAVCAEMGQTLQRSAFSPNIKERRDFSCALFNAAGELIAQGDNIPVHLGSMPASVAAAIATHRMEPGDVVLLNDPYSGGTHLPDLTCVCGWWAERGSDADPGRPQPADAHLAVRAHHSDVGGMSGGSLPLGRELFAEGLVLPPVRIVKGGRLDEDLLAVLCANSRSPDERRGDLLAQLGALHRGALRLHEAAQFMAGVGTAELDAIASGPRLQGVWNALIERSAAAAQALIASLPESIGSAVVGIDLDAQLTDGQSDQLGEIRVSVQRRGERLRVDFTGTSPQHAGPFNAVRAITVSAVYYVLRCLLPPEVPATAGVLRSVDIVTQPGTLVDAQPPAAVAAGNVETSQRIVLAVLEALRGLLPDRIPAASQGTMNNLLISGRDQQGRPFTYYETLAGGHGAGPSGAGLSARHSHMTNSLNTPVEALGHAYPLRVRRYGVRSGSGGAGRHAGGAGVVREIEFLSDAEVTLLRQGVESGPAGTAGGGAGQPGVAELTGPDGTIERLPASCTRQIQAGSLLRIETPGGGGWGEA